MNDPNCKIKHDLKEVVTCEFCYENPMTYNTPEVKTWICGLCEQESGKYGEIIDFLPEHSRHCRKRIEKELFEMVYQWGKFGVVTDEKCNAFQEKINLLIK